MEDAKLDVLPADLSATTDSPWRLIFRGASGTPTSRLAADLGISCASAGSLGVLRTDGNAVTSVPKALLEHFSRRSASQITCARMWIRLGFGVFGIVLHYLGAMDVDDGRKN